MLVSVTGDPIPPQEMVRRLQQIDPDLGLKWVKGMERWGVTLAWPRADKRWAMVQRGELGDGAAYDILGYLPEDCTADEAYGYFVRTFKAWSGKRGDVERLLNRVYAYNENVSREASRPVEEYAEEMIRWNKSRLFPGVQ